MYKKLYLLSWLFYGALIVPAIELNITPYYSPSKALDLTVHTHRGAGFFCEFNKVLKALIHFEDQGLYTAQVNWNDPFFPYKDNPNDNGWNSYFEPIKTNYPLKENESITKQGACGGLHEIHDQLCVCHWVAYKQYFPYRNYVHQKINQYIEIKSHILDELNELYETNMKDHFLIGIHVRFARAHAHEVPGGPPSLNQYMAEADKLIKQHPSEKIKIFIASDSHYVVNQFKKKYGTKLFYIDAYRANHSEDPGLIYENQQHWVSHPQQFHNKKPGYNGGKTTLLDCLLLSKCDYLIHTASNLSAAVVFFNPHIKSIYLPKTNFRPCRYKGSTTIKNPYINPI